MIYTVGHPNGSIQEATSTVEANLVPVTGEAIDKLVAENAYYAKAMIPGGMYAGTPDDVEMATSPSSRCAMAAARVSWAGLA